MPSEDGKRDARGRGRRDEPPRVAAVRCRRRAFPAARAAGPSAGNSDMAAKPRHPRPARAARRSDLPSAPSRRAASARRRSRSPGWRAPCRRYARGRRPGPILVLTDMPPLSSVRNARATSSLQARASDDRGQMGRLRDRSCPSPPSILLGMEDQRLGGERLQRGDARGTTASAAPKALKYRGAEHGSALSGREGRGRGGCRGWRCAATRARRNRRRGTAQTEHQGGERRATRVEIADDRLWIEGHVHRRVSFSVPPTDWLDVTRRPVSWLAGCRPSPAPSRFPSGSCGRTRRLQLRGQLRLRRA
jgi:hypothetical protein